ncbi:MAG: L-rhamnose mutarotase, partial [Gaiellales bacterium]|nr:L-rhamnose mutarotase [Gaiellales bacterium]
DAETAFAKVGAHEASPRWNEYFKDIIVSLTGPDGQLVDYKEVWHLA